MLESFRIYPKFPRQIFKPLLMIVSISLKQPTRDLDLLSPRLHNHIVFMHNSPFSRLTSLDLLYAHNVTETDSIECSTA